MFSKIVFSLLAILIGNTGQAFAYQIGELVGGATFIYDEPIEGVYGNAWFALETGSARGPADETLLKMEVLGEGKTVDFRGVLLVSCDTPSRSVWQSATNFGVKDSSVVPKQAIHNLVRLFCR